MATAVGYTKSGSKQAESVKLDAAVFGLEANHELLDLAYRAYLANGRGSHAKTLTRGEVRGGGKKPWKQKGTGRARVGSSRVPNWRGGGVVFGATGNENYTINMPIQMKRLAIRQALSIQAADKKIIILEDFATEGRVKTTVELLGKMGVQGNIVLAVDEKTQIIDRATRNVEGLHTVSAQYFNVFTILNADAIIITQKSLPVISAWLGEKADKKPAVKPVAEVAPEAEAKVAPKAAAKPKAAPKAKAEKT
jgi:large subunit ribosomal protein L4